MITNKGDIIMKYLLILFAMIMFLTIGCSKDSAEPIAGPALFGDYNSPAGIGFYISQQQMDAETDLQKFHMDNFLDEGNLNELLWMAKGGDGHEPFQILVTSGKTDTLWLSPIFITGYIECERQLINKPFHEELEIQIIRSDFEKGDYPINIYVTTIITKN